MLGICGLCHVGAIIGALGTVALHCASQFNFMYMFSVFNPDRENHVSLKSGIGRRDDLLSLFLS